jgi:hypothetical protein
MQCNADRSTARHRCLGSFSARRSDPQMRPGARDSWSGPACALLRLHGSAGLAHTTHTHALPLAARLLQRTRASQPASPTRSVQSPRRFFSGSELESEPQPPTWAPAHSCSQPGRTDMNSGVKAEQRTPLILRTDRLAALWGHRQVA